MSAFDAQSYCRVCDEVFGGAPWKHESEAHPDEDVEVKRIQRTNADGERITESDEGMGHYGPHHFTPVEGVLLCPECGALNIDGDAKDWP